eukprot:2667379-Amphidinium_carterae.1
MSSSSQATNIVYDSAVYSSMLAAAFGDVRVSQGDVQMSDSQPSAGIIMSDTFALLNSSPQASPLPSPFPINDQWESRSRPDMEMDPKNVPLPESGSERDEWEDVPDVQEDYQERAMEEPEEEEAPDEVPGSNPDASTTEVSGVNTDRVHVPVEGERTKMVTDRTTATSTTSDGHMNKQKRSVQKMTLLQPVWPNTIGMFYGGVVQFATVVPCPRP